jgi:hypothetical protein
MDSLGIEEKYRLSAKPSPYQTAIDMLGNLETCYSPLDKINCLLNTVTAMKTEVVDYSAGKLAVETMDDEFPILIFVTVNSTVRNMVSEVRFLQDYILDSVHFEKESRLLTDFEATVFYISENWT